MLLIYPTSICLSAIVYMNSYTQDLIARLCDARFVRDDLLRGYSDLIGIKNEKRQYHLI